MPRSGGRLNLAGALKRNMAAGSAHLNPLNSCADSSSSSKHASVCRLERELKTSQEDNTRLRDQLEDTRCALKQITSEASHEKFDERRVNMLKLQIIQLQRQTLLMSEALGSRSKSVMEVENALTWFSGKFRHYIGAEVKGWEVPVLRADLMTMLETSESARIKLFKNVENCSRENLARPQMFMNSFLKPGADSEFTVLDCCLGRVDCLNLKHVGQLESKLGTLYKELIKVSEYLNSSAKSGHGTWTGQGHDSLKGQDQCSVKGQGHIMSAVREREGTLILRAGAMARDCAADLLSLSLLLPSAPWPPVKHGTQTEVTYDALAGSLPALPRGKAGQVKHCVTAALKVTNHRCHMARLEAGALREEVRFHQAVYQLQLDYVLQAFDALSDGYLEFEKSTNDILIQPLKKLMGAYNKLSKNTTQQGLKTFLTILKGHEDQWVDVIEKLETSEPHNGSQALSVFGREFLASLDGVVLARQAERDSASGRREDLKAAQQRLEGELRAVIRDGEEQAKIGRELKGDQSASHVNASSLSGAASSPDVSQSFGGQAKPEVKTWQDESSVDQRGVGVKKEGSSRREASRSRKPWVDGGDSSDRPAPSTGLTDALSEELAGPGRQPGSQTGLALRSWLDQPLYTHAGSRKPDWDSGAAPDNSDPDTGQVHHGDTPLDRAGRKGKSRRSKDMDLASGDVGAQTLAHPVRERDAQSGAFSPSGGMGEKSARPMSNAEWLSYLRGESPSVEGVDAHFALVTDRSSQSSDSRASHRAHPQQNPAHTEHAGISLSTRSDGMDSHSQFFQSHQQADPVSQSSHMQADCQDGGCSSGKPPLAVESSLSTQKRTGGKKGKGGGGKKPLSYQPNLYVPNRTLSLRRSGSLTKLAEPSLEERMKDLSASNSQRMDRSRSSSRQSNR